MTSVGCVTAVMLTRAVEGLRGERGGEGGRGRACEIELRSIVRLMKVYDEGGGFRR